MSYRRSRATLGRTGVRVKVGLIAAGIVLAALGFAAAIVIVPGASAHSNPCHSQHTCPSDHHTYVWTDTTSGTSYRPPPNV